MTWTASGVFAAFFGGQLNATNIFDLDQTAGNTTDVYKVALYNNTPTPDKTVAVANTCYNVDQWASANEVSIATYWPAGGVQIGATAGQTSGVAANMTITVTTNTIKFAANNTSSGASATLVGVYGTLIYDDTKTGTPGAGSNNVSTGSAPTAKSGVCFNYLGGTNSVTTGTFQVVWNTSGIFTVSV